MSTPRLVIIDGVRTPFCKMGTDFARLGADELGRVAVNALLTRTAIDPGIIDGTITEEDVEFIGQVFVPEPGTSVDMYLLGLPAGVYTLACFVPTEEGDPHAFHGMMTPFEVTAPVEEASPAA